MRRRELVVAAIGAVLGGCLERRDPSGPRNPPTGDAPPGADTEKTTQPPGLRIVDRGFSERDDGTLRIDATIGNTAADRRTGTLVVTAATPEEEATETREVSVDPGAEIEVTVTFDLLYEAFINGGSLSVNVEP
ncbi:hypothetical protein [Halopenitus sp. POP-27]|uniref:hypothetical protein n=1 Tax=Halopenitus sp. POP-27 TaxID=2994425 RepID=UPI00246903E4|nr:hypothetical protein [Halopenitus sp. POP-27]